MIDIYLFMEAESEAIHGRGEPDGAQHTLLADGGDLRHLAALPPRHLCLHAGRRGGGGAAAAGEPVCEGGPAEGHSGEGEDQPGGAAGERVQRAEGQAHAALTRGQGVAEVHRRDGLHQEGDDQVGEADVGQQEVPGRHLSDVRRLLECGEFNTSQAPSPSIAL